MAPHLSDDTKHRIIAAVQAGKKVKDIAEMFGVSVRTVQKLMEKSKTRPEGISRKKGSGGHNKIGSMELNRNLNDKINENPKVSARKLARDFEVTHSTVLKSIKVHKWALSLMYYQ